MSYLVAQFGGRFSTEPACEPITCECVYREEADEMDSQDCPVHADVCGKPLPNGVCCERFRVSNIRHDATCFNHQEGEDELERSRR